MAAMAASVTRTVLPGLRAGVQPRAGSLHCGSRDRANSPSAALTKPCARTESPKCGTYLAQRPASPGSTPHTAAHRHGFQDRGTPSISAGHRRAIGTKREWGGWDSNPRPTDHESSPPAARAIGSDLGRRGWRDHGCARFGHVFGMIMVDAGAGRITLRSDANA
jgi:hypothetical protein